MMFSHRLFKFFILMTLVLGYPTSGALAHGGGVPQLTNAKAGPYQVSVWTQPDPLRVGEVHFTVAVSEPGPTGREAGSPVLDAVVELQLVPPGEKNKPPLRVSATHNEAVNKLFYEADINLPAEGPWQVSTSVKGPSGSGQTNFTVEVLPPSAFNWWIVLGGAAVVITATGWVVVKSSK